MRIYIAKCKGNSPVQSGDQVSINSTLVSVSGPIGSNAVCVLQPQSPITGVVFPTYTAQASDSLGSSGQGICLAYDGYQIYGTIGESCTTPGVVQAIISGVGSVAVISVLLNSGAVVLVPSGSCTTNNQRGSGPSAQ